MANSDRDLRRGVVGPTLRGSIYSVGAAGVTILFGLVRSIALARLLLPEHFGVVALALFFVNLAGQLRALGLDRALLHRQTTEGAAYETYLALKLVLAGGTTLLLILAAPWIARFYPEQPLLAPMIVALAGITLLSTLNQIQETLLGMAFNFRAIAMTNVSASVVMTVVAPYLAWRGWGAWSLVAELGSGILIRTVLLWGPFRVGAFRPQFDRAEARRFWHYGRANWISTNVGFLLDRFDDFWVGTALGKTPLGFYAKAYEFARYPRRLLANPLVSVLAPVFARLQDDRLQLSKAYFRLMSLLVRTGFLAGGLAVLLAPEFVFYVLGAKWMPMVSAFQLMIVYVLLDPLLMTTGNLLLAVGAPGGLARARVGQLLFFIPAVILGARWGGIEGVALAADGMLLVGFVLLYRTARRHVDYSVLRLFAWPAVGAILGLVAVGFLVGMERIGQPQPWNLAALKAGAFALPFCVWLFVFERRELAQMARLAWASLRGGQRAALEEG
ncbi:MAG: lipopolysaccharide biosynthesis protein [Ardenticatenia bacterium]|nr:lipopolysaccharide biosynthesis protein [Ardenticatenia bacterium]